MSTVTGGGQDGQKSILKNHRDNLARELSQIDKRAAATKNLENEINKNEKKNTRNFLDLQDLLNRGFEEVDTAVQTELTQLKTNLTQHKINKNSTGNAEITTITKIWNSISNFFSRFSKFFC